ncbi:MAG: DUF1841 family protein [Burkholderiales bacterium]|nr:DUF1841 family protein [Burkholderiales bacterium]
MFNLNQDDVRNFFFDVWDKSQANSALTDLEKIALTVILEHPEYNYILDNREKYLNHQWNVASGETNPFLHFGMHLSIVEQLSIDQPPGVKSLYQQLCNKVHDPHEASHELMDCLSEMIWTAQKYNQPLDAQIYFNCINKKLGHD